MSQTARNDEGGGCFLRSIVTGKFFKTPTAWADTLTSAFKFATATDALKMAGQIGTEHLEMLFTDERGRILFGTRLDDPSPPPAPPSAPAPTEEAANRPQQPC